jgi:SAM-dependent methyltransferase
MVDALAISSADEVVEFAPGLGATARIVLAKRPASFTAVEADTTAAARLEATLGRSGVRAVAGKAQETGLPDGQASVVYGEAMLTMQTPATKLAIVKEARRLLRPGGRYGIHELSIVPDDVDEATKTAIESALSDSIHVGARPLTEAAWRELLEEAGFVVRASASAPMHLLEPKRLLSDEGVKGSARFAFNLLRDREARSRVLAMRKVFRRHQEHLGAVMLVAEVPQEG